VDYINGRLTPPFSFVFGRKQNLSSFCPHVNSCNSRLSASSLGIQQLPKVNWLNSLPFLISNIYCIESEINSMQHKMRKEVSQASVTLPAAIIGGIY